MNQEMTNMIHRQQSSIVQRFFFLLLLLASALTALAQATQPCIVKQYNQKQTKTPLGGVQVEVRDAGSAISDKAGQLTLKFATLKPGDKVTLRRITKTGFEIFNKTAIEQWNVSSNRQRFEIVLVQSSYFAQLKGKLTQSSTDNYKKKYEQEKAEKVRLLKEGKLKEEEYRQQLNDLEDQYDNALKNLDNYIDQFARIDLSEVSAEEQRILDMVQAGQIDEAVKAYEALDISGKLRQARENKKALSEAKARIEEEEAQQEQAIKDLKEKQQREIATLKLVGGKDNYDKIAKMLKENALADTTDIDAVLEYAKFADIQKNYIDALHFYTICLHICPSEQLSHFQHVIGSVHYVRKKYDEARNYFLLSLETARHNKDSEMEAMANQSLGTLYYNYFVNKTYEYYNNYNIVEDYWTMALNIYSLLYKNYPTLDNTSNLINMEIKMGVLYTTKEEYTKAEQYYLSAKEHCELLVSKSPDKYLYDLADIHDRLAKYYTFRSDSLNMDPKIDRDKKITEHNKYLSLAEKHYLSAMDICKQLFEQNPDDYRQHLSLMQSRIGAFYYQKKRDLGKAKYYFSNTFINDSILYSKNPNVYCLKYATSKVNLGIMYAQDGDWTKVEELFLSALNNYITEYNQDSEADGNHDRLIEHINRLISLYSKDLKDYGKAEKYLKEIVRIEKERYDADNTNEFEKRLKEAITELGGFYLQNEKIEEGEKTYEQIHQIDSKESVNWNIGVYYYNVASELVKKKDSISAEKNYLAALVYFNRFLNEDKSETLNIRIISNALYNLGAIYYNRKDYTKAEEFFLQTLEQDIQLFTRKPVAYRDNLALMQMRLADMYDETKDYIQAEQYYLQALENYKVLFSDKPDNYRKNLAWIQYSLMYIYARGDDKLDQYEDMLDAALANYEVLYQNDKDYQPTIVKLRNRKGWRLLQKGDTDEAMSLFESTYQLDPEKSVTYLASSCNAKAYEYTKTGNFPKALETIDRAIALMPEDANLYDSKGEILLMKGDEQEALKMWQKVLELDPDFLTKYEGGTDFYKQLKEKGLIIE